MDVDADTNPKTTTTTSSTTTAKAPASLSPTPAPAPEPAMHNDSDAAGPAAAQLALLLSTALAESESLRAALHAAERRAKRAERVLAALQMPAGAPSSSASGPAAPRPALDAADNEGAQSDEKAKEKEKGTEDVDTDADAEMDVENSPADATKMKTKSEDKERTTTTTTMPEAAVKAILDAEARAERAERYVSSLCAPLHFVLSTHFMSKHPFVLSFYYTLPRLHLHSN